MTGESSSALALSIYACCCSCACVCWRVGAHSQLQRAHSSRAKRRGPSEPSTCLRARVPPIWHTRPTLNQCGAVGPSDLPINNSASRIGVHLSAQYFHAQSLNDIRTNSGLAGEHERQSDSHNTRVIETPENTHTHVRVQIFTKDHNVQYCGRFGFLSVVRLCVCVC